MATQPQNKKTKEDGVLGTYINENKDLLNQVGEETGLDDFFGDFDFADIIQALIAFLTGFGGDPKTGYTPIPVSKDLSQTLAGKSAAIVEYQKAAEFYVKAMEKDGEIGDTFTMEDRNGNLQTYEIAEIERDGPTGYDGRIIRNIETGDLVIVHGGMDEYDNGFDTGDFASIGEALAGKAPGQMGPARKLLERAAAMDGNRLQVIGYSAGGFLAADAAALGVESIAISNPGTPLDMKQPNGQPFYSTAQLQNMSAHLTNIILPGDRAVGMGGSVLGEKITLKTPTPEQFQALDAEGSSVKGMGLRDQFNTYSGSLLSKVTGPQHHITAYLVASQVASQETKAAPDGPNNNPPQPENETQMAAANADAFEI